KGQASYSPRWYISGGAFTTSLRGMVFQINRAERTHEPHPLTTCRWQIRVMQVLLPRDWLNMDARVPRNPAQQKLHLIGENSAVGQNERLMPIGYVRNIQQRHA